MGAKPSVLWQDYGHFDEATARRMARINPEVIVISGCGPGCNRGPTPQQMREFVRMLRRFGFTNKIAYHPDCTKGSFKYWLSNDDHPFRVYLDYTAAINNALLEDGERLSEVMMESEGSPFGRGPEVYHQMRAYMNTIGLQDVLLAATGGPDQNIPAGADLHYVQMYDLGPLRVPNPPGDHAAIVALVDRIIDYIDPHRARIDHEYTRLIFSYYPHAENGPVFGAPPHQWSYRQFCEFLTCFHQRLAERWPGHARMLLGTWDCDTALAIWGPELDA